MRKAVFSVVLTALCLAFQEPIAAQGRRAQAGDTTRVTPPAAAPAVSTPAPAAPAVSTPAPTAPAPSAAPVPAAADTAARPAPPPMAVDSASRLAPDTGAAAAAPAADSAGRDTVSAPAGKPRKRKRVVRETTVNTIDELKGRYRSPKKALFMSLVVPGLGQAYVGQSALTYARGAAYLLTDVGLYLGWRHYVGTKQDRAIERYRDFADANWRMSRYEAAIADQLTADLADNFADLNTHRVTYCQSVQSGEGNVGADLYRGCSEPRSDPAAHERFREAYRDETWDLDTVTARRRGEFPNALNFYELIGKEVEFSTGWADGGDIRYDDTSYFRLDPDGNRIAATTDLQQEYISLRAKANDYARMQAWFLGGMVVNHLVSALDAALTAHFHNKRLYQTDIGFLDRLRLDSHVAWDGSVPVPTVTAYVTF